LRLAEEWHKQNPQQLQSLALVGALYRAGQFNQALRPLDPIDLSFTTLPWQVLIHHRLGKAAETKQYLLMASNLLKDPVNYPKGTVGPAANLAPVEWITFQVLWREATELATGSPTSWPQLWTGRAVARAALGAWKRAEESWTEVLKLEPKVPGHWLARGRTYLEQQRWDKADADLKQAVELEPQNVQLLLDRGRLYAEHKRWDQARADLNRVLELREGNLLFVQEAARILARGEQWELAAAIYTQILQTWPKELPATAGEVAPSEPLRKRVAELRKNDKVLHLEIARALAREGKTSEAFTFLDMLLTWHPGEPLYLWERGALFASKGEWDKAAADSNQAFQREPDDPELWLQVGYLRLQTGDLARYRDVCRDMLAYFGKTEDPALAARIATLALLSSHGLGDPGPLVKLANRADPTKTSWWQRASALAHLRTGEYAKALPHLKNPWPDATAPSFWLVKAQVLFYQGETEEARKCLDKGSQLLDKADPKKGNLNKEWQERVIGLALHREAQSLLNAPERLAAAKCLREEKWAEAIGHLDRLLATDAGHWTDRLARGRTHARLKQWDKVVADFFRTIDLLPEDALARGATDDASQRSRVYEELVRWDEAFAAAVKQRPKDKRLWIARAHLYALRGQWDEAAATYRQVLAELNVHDGFACACISLLAGEKAGYQQVFQQLLKRHEPDDLFAGYVLARTFGLAPGAPADPADAIRWGQQAVASGASAWRLHALGLAHFRAGNLDPAAEALEKSNKMSWGKPSVLNTLALALVFHHKGDATTARQRWNEATKQLVLAGFESGKEARNFPEGFHPADWLEALVLRAEAEALLNAPHRREAEECVKKKQWAQAIEHLDALIQADPNFGPDRAARGEAHALLGHWKEAAADYARAVAWKPQDPFYGYKLAAAHLSGGDIEAYRKVCADLIERFGTTDKPAVANRVAHTCLAVPNAVDPQKLLPLAKLALNVTNINKRLLAAVLCRAGKYEEAIPLFQQNLTSYDRAWDRLFLAMAYHHRGLKTEASEQFKTACRLAEETEKNDTWLSWFERAEVVHLRQEVETLLKKDR
jgi:tetratricopeptide (TPR) repeat protein